MRIAILGNSGSGKSTLARRLAQVRGAAHLDLDDVAWEPGAGAVPRDPAAARADVAAFCARHEAWVVEGCYASLVAVALPFGAQLLWLDPDVAQCEAHCRARPWEPHKYPSRAEQDAQLPALLEWVRGYWTRDGELSRRGHQALFEVFAGSKRVLRNPDDIDALVTELCGDRHA